MKTTAFTCPMCGYRFDPGKYTACNACPLKRGCELACCPQCGYKTVNPSESGLARLAARWFFREPLEERDALDLVEHRSNHP